MSTVDRRWRGRARRAFAALLGLVGVLAVNLATVERWWLRSALVPWRAAVLLWCADVAIVVLVARSLRSPRELSTSRGGVAVMLVAVVSVAASLLLLEALLRLYPQLAVEPSLARELGWRARHASGSTRLPTNWEIDQFSPALGWELRANLRLAGCGKARREHGGLYA